MEQIPFPNKKYQIIYADPPWSFNFQKRNSLSDEAKGRLYPTTRGQDIVDLPVSEIAADNAVLFLWVMSSELPLALDVIKGWGFTYKTVAFTWVKTTVNGKYCFGGGNWTRSNPELCLLATKGKPKRISASVRELVVSERRQHSRKPDEIRQAIVELVGDLPRIELFAREKTEGWDVWGNEV
jgi:N6-adenosine-specific RNA methylase IME4